MSATRTNAREVRFNAVVDAVYEPLQRYLGRRVPPDDASEVLNDTLLVVWRRLDDVPPGDPLPWAYGVAKRSLANHRRGDARRHRLEDRVAGVARADRQGGPSWTGSAENALAVALYELDETERELIRLWAWEQLEPREIAIVLETTANAVSLRLTRAKRRLSASIVRQDRETAGHKVVGHRKAHQS